MKQALIPINQDQAIDERCLVGGYSEEASTLGFNGYYRLYWGSDIAGVWIKQPSGQLIPFRHTSTERDADGDIQVWYFAHEGHVLTIFND